jgi:hypothetical protein
LTEVLQAKIVGIDALNMKFKDKKRIEKPMNNYLNRAMIKLKELAIRVTPVGATGQLWSSYKTRLDARKMEGTVFNAAVSEGFFYGYHLEFSNLQPKRRGTIPFFAPAFQKLQDDELPKLRKKLKDEIEKRMKKK